ncbi:hypothetical protein D3C74_253350 [compost metagenome]
MIARSQCFQSHTGIHQQWNCSGATIRFQPSHFQHCSSEGLESQAAPGIDMAQKAWSFHSQPDPYLSHVNTIHLHQEYSTPTDQCQQHPNL